MPSLAAVTKAVVPAGTSLAEYLASRSGLNRATGAITQGASAAGAGLNNASAAAIEAQKQALTQQRGIAGENIGRTTNATAAAIEAQKQALAKQNELYRSTVEANAPYTTAGQRSIAELQKLIDNPTKFDASAVEGEPGYQFGMNQGLKAVTRTAQAAGTLGNGGQYARATRQALDFASQKYNDAFNRLMQVEQQREGLLKSGATIGQNANAANAGAGVTLGNQTQANANNVGNIETQGANANNATMGTLGQQIGTEANNEGTLGTNNAENQAALTLAQAQLQAKNQGLQSNNAVSTLGTIAEQIPTIANLFKKGAPAAAAIPGVLGGGTATAGTGAAATGITGALGLGGGSGLLGLGAATIPVVGGIIAGGALLAKHFVGEGRKTADKLTGQGGIQHAFEDTLNQIDGESGYTAEQKWQSKVQAYDKLEELALAFAKKGKNERKTASQLFDTIAPLFGKSNPLKAAA